MAAGFDKVGCSATSATGFDKAIELTGYGSYHYKINAVCALCLLTSGFQNGLASYVFPAAQSELQITLSEMSFLNVSFLIGTISSAFVWGAVADLSGRRTVLLLTLALNVCVTAVTACMQNFLGIAICRYVSGFLMGAPGSVTFNYVAEFYGPKRQAKSVCYSGMFFTVAWLILPVLAYFILPLDSLYIGNGMFLSPWRLFLIVISLPELITAICIYFMPESPKYLAERGDAKGALKILQDMYVTNKRRRVEDYPVKQLASKKLSTVRSFDSGGYSKVTRLFNGMLKQMKELLGYSNLFYTVLACSIMFCNMFGYFGLGLWLPDLFQRFETFHEQFPNRTVTVQHLTSHAIPTNNTYEPEFDAKLFYNTLTIGAASLVGNILSGWISGKVSMKLVPLITMFVGAVASGSIYWLTSSMQNLVVASIFQASMATANVAIGSVAVELFPTSVAAMALCFILFVGRLGAVISNVVFGLLMDSRCEIPIFMVSAMLLLGTVLCLFIPSSKANKSNFDIFNKNKLHIDIAFISSNECKA